MRKYGVNWVLFYIGFVITFAAIMFWACLMYDLLWPSHGGDRGLSRAVSWSAQALWQGALVFWAARNQAKQKAKAGQATEEKPFVAFGKNDGVVFTTYTTPQRVRLRNLFGISSAVVGAVTLIAHLVSGKIGVWQIAAYTLCVPLCLIFGIYLAEKAREPDCRKMDTADRLNQTEKLPTTATLPQTSQEEKPALLSRGR